MDELLPNLQRWLSVQNSSSTVRVLVLGAAASAANFGRALRCRLQEGAAVEVDWSSSIADYEEALEGGGGGKPQYDLVIDVGLLQSLLRPNPRSVGEDCTERMTRTVRLQMLPADSGGVFLLVSACKWVRRPLKLGGGATRQGKTPGWCRHRK